MLRYAILLFSLLFFGASSNSETDPDSLFMNQITIDGNRISGTVTLPSVSTQRRSFRGRAYRSRGSGSTNTSDNADSNPITDTIISLHPISYEIDADPLDEPVTINQKDAVFIPNVTPVTVGSIVQFVNDDPFYHNVFSLTPGARFNIGRRPTGDVYTKKIPATQWKVEGLGEIQLFCDIHSQMNAVILSLDTPYFTRVDENGNYVFEDIPDGKYEVRAYNPRFDLDSREITVGNDQSVTLDIDFSN